MITKESRVTIVGGLLTILFSLSLGACSSRQSDSKSTNEPGWTVSADIKLDGQLVDIAGIAVHPPSTWKDLGPSGMRQGNYILAPVSGDADSATMAIFYFGQNRGGSVKDNIERWINQMAMPNGGDPHTVVTSKDLTVDGMAVHAIDLSGTYNAPVGNMMSGETVAKPGYHMSAAVVETPGGNLFFKLTGPEKTAAEMEKGFRQMILGIKKTGKSS